MSEYCKQCFEKLVLLDNATMTDKRKTKFFCQGCGDTVVDGKGRCVGACTKDEHASIFMSYIMKTQPPDFKFAHVEEGSKKRHFFKFIADGIQWVPRAMFVVSLFYMLVVSIFGRIRYNNCPEQLEIITELACARSSRIYACALNFWSSIEMKLEDKLFG